MSNKDKYWWDEADWEHDKCGWHEVHHPPFHLYTQDAGKTICGAKSVHDEYGWTVKHFRDADYELHILLEDMEHRQIWCPECLAHPEVQFIILAKATT